MRRGQRGCDGEGRVDMTTGLRHSLFTFQRQHDEVHDSYRHLGIITYIDQSSFSAFERAENLLVQNQHCRF